MILIIFILQTIISGFISCDETKYETLVLEPTNPFYKEQFQMNESDFKKDTDALEFGIWSQYRPYQDILESYQVDYAFQPNSAINGDLLFSIRNVETNVYETAYFLYYPLLSDFIQQKIAQLQVGSLNTVLLATDTLKYEGYWVYTHIQFVPLMSQIYVYFHTYGYIRQRILKFQLNKYGKKEIIIGGTGKIFNFYNLGSFHGRMSRPIRLQQGQMFKDTYEFQTYYNSCNVPKSCSGPIKIDIIKDLLYMDSTMYFNQTIKLYENAYSFGGWVKVDYSNIVTRSLFMLVRATINRDYKNSLNLGDTSFAISYEIDLFSNFSYVDIYTYSYSIPQIGSVKAFGFAGDKQFSGEYIQNQLQQWHFIKYTYGNSIELGEIFFPNIKLSASWYFKLDDSLQGGYQFTSEYLYLHIGADKYSRQFQFKGWIKDFQIWTCLQNTVTPVNITCHYTCLPTSQCQPDRKCELCPSNSHRSYLQTTKFCECEEGYYTVLNQPICENFQNNFNFLQFSNYQFINSGQCKLGYYQYQNQCYECPSKLNDNYKVSCLECIYNKLDWYIHPVCETDYIKLIGGDSEPFYSNKRPINEIDLFKINSFNYLELCQGCYKYCDSLSSECFLSNNYHLGNQMIVQCKNNYYFDQFQLACFKCINNCKICSQHGICLQCEEQHYFDPIQQQCLQCDIRCQECQFDQQLNQQVCISCPEYFTLYNGKCLKCGVKCKFCLADHYVSTGEVYARCYQCLDNKKYFISFDATNCQVNTISNCQFAFQYYKDDRHVQTIDLNFQPMALNSSIITACAKCKIQYVYVISENICIVSQIGAAEYLIQENRSSEMIILADIYNLDTNLTRIQSREFPFPILNCESCIYSKTDQNTKRSLCYIGFYLQRLRGNCLKCPTKLNCQVCQQQQKINKDSYKLEFMAFYEWFVNFDKLHDYGDYAQSQNEEDFEILCTSCHFGYQLVDGQCVQDCPDNCAECIQQNGELQCLRCFDTIQGVMQTLVNNQCIQCPFNCAVCLPQDSIKVYQYNPYFQNTEYVYFTNLCLKLITKLPENKYFHDPEMGNYIECGEQQQCYQEVHFEIVVHCNDQQYEQLLQQSPNKIEFKQQNIKLSQLFSTSTESHIPEYENDLVYTRFNQKQIKKINQTYIFTNISKCVIQEDSLQLKNQFIENVYSIKETVINFIGRDENVKIYFNNQLYIDGFTHVLFKNIELMLITTNIFNNQSNFVLYPVNSIIISHLISVELLLERIKFSALSHDSSISLQILNSSSLTINNCELINQNFQLNNFINIQNPLWQLKGLQSSDVMNVTMENVSLLNCTFTNSSLLNIMLDNKFIFNFKNILIQAEFSNSFFVTQFKTLQFSKNIILFDTINIQSKIIDTDGFINLEYIDQITLKSLTYSNSILSNSTFIKSNNQFVFNHLQFLKLQMLGNSILLKYEESKLVCVKHINILNLNIQDVSYEKIHPFIYFVDLGNYNQLNLNYLNLEGNYLAQQLQKSKLEVFYYSALIYVEMPNIFMSNINILRKPGYQEFSLVNTQNITLLNVTINQLEPIKGLHQYLDCLQQQNYGNQYFSVLWIFQAKYILLDKVEASKLIFYNHPLIMYQSVDLSQKSQQEIIKITNSVFFSNLILIIDDIKSSSIIMIESEQQIEIEINEITFQQNQLNIYSKGNSINSCLINLQCIYGKVFFNQLKVIDNLVTNDISALFYLNVQQLLLKNSEFLRNNYLDYEKIKGNLMWSFPNNLSQITSESLQNLFPIQSDGIFMVIFEVLLIDNITIRQAQGCKGGVFQLYSKQSGIVNITNSYFKQIRASSNCDQSFGGALYIDSTNSKLIATISQISIDKVMSLNLGGFIYVTSASKGLNIVISHVIAKNFNSLKGSFLYASLPSLQSIVQELHIYNCSLTNEFHDFVEYMGYLSTFQNYQILQICQKIVFNSFS